ncbi:hypothetical protein [Clostridium thermosuccinogenes]|uniref:hypothetical protein n=1 Tax=Clostridium thermosuccinogenes TaxID=84032 RepID=UPI001375171C|nr:hypothetical protein [Pseudoclostridium thermosuccinogenes]
MKEDILPEEMKLFFKYLCELIGDTMMIGFYRDGTFSIPDGNAMYDFVYALLMIRMK